MVVVQVAPEGTAMPPGHVPEDEPQGIEEVLARFNEVTPVGSGWSALCPAHDDRSPSLSIGEGDDGRILLKCHAGCDTEVILDAAGLQWEDLFNPRQGGSGMPTRRQEPLSEEESGFRDRAYRSLLEQMGLSGEHRGRLRARGLSDQVITANGYRSLDWKSAYLSPRPYRDFPEERLRTLPGFRQRKEEDYPPIPGVRPHTVTRFKAGPGTLIPVRDARGRIVSGQVRLFDSAGPKYRWLNSSRSLPHVPLGVTAPCPVIRVTEGPLKADVASQLSPEIPTVGVGGVSAWRAALPLLVQLGAEEVRLAFDADWQDNPAVANSLRAFGDELERRGYTVTSETWDKGLGKGIDDLLKAGGRPRAVTLDEARKSASAPHEPNRGGGGRPLRADCGGSAHAGRAAHRWQRRRWRGG
jgi:hypothetical protein